MINTVVPLVRRERLLIASFDTDFKDALVPSPALAPTQAIDFPSGDQDSPLYEEK
jgi:hypothetical protein